MRPLPFAVFIAFAISLADQPPRSLTGEETRALQQQIALGRRIIVALTRYSDAIHEANAESSDMWARGMGALGLVTRTPTMDVLHAARYITDSDQALAHRCHATPQPLPAGAPVTQPLLTMQCDRGELVFDTQGAVALHTH